jgi:sensor histidine kinase YesM
LDKEQRRQDMMLLSQILLMTPLSVLMQGNMPRMWTLARALIETFDVPEVTTFIGTMQDAMQAQMAQMQEAQRQQKLAESAELLKQVFSHTKFNQPTAPARPGQGNGQQQAVRQLSQ